MEASEAVSELVQEILFFGVFINKLWFFPVASGLPLSAALSSIVLLYQQSVRNALIESD